MMTWYPPELQLRRLMAADAEQVVVLSREANWNQTAVDWRLLIEQGEAQALWQQQRPLASALILPYGGSHNESFGWISMVLVSAAWRRRGFATALLHSAIAQLRARGLTPGLDATEAGRPVYQKLGFQDVYSISRMALEQQPAVSAAPGGLPSGLHIRPLQADDLAMLTSWDALQFGAGRGIILQALHERLPRSAFLAVGHGGEPAGFILARDGRVASQLGPLVAAGVTIAGALIASALPTLSGPVFIDAPDRHPGWIDVLQQLGFRRQRGFSRMLYQRHQAFDRSERIFAIAGPELG
jgi:GNAT superfamily N-acetyltransferase